MEYHYKAIALSAVSMSWVEEVLNKHFSEGWQPYKFYKVDYDDQIIILKKKK